MSATNPPSFTTVRNGFASAAELDLVPAMLQDEGEFAELLNVIGVAWPRAILELGVFQGGTLARFAERYPDARVIGVDPELQPEARALWRLYPNVALVEGRSDDPRARALALDLAGGPFDVVHIDGDHSLATARADWVLALHFTRRPALVAFHDVNRRRYNLGEPPQVDGLWDELDADEKLQTQTIGDRDEYGIGVVWLS